MSEELELLARQVALRLRRLQGSHGTQYVRVGTAPPTAVVSNQAQPGPDAPQTQRAPQTQPTQRQRAPQAQHVPQAQQATRPAAAPPRPPTRNRGKSIDAKEALRSQAESWSAATKLEYLRKKNVGNCQRCGLCQTRKNIVFGVGNAETKIMFVGEAPGGDEDRVGEPFVGRAGQLLDRWLIDLGMSRADVYIANVLKCRPPGNRDPQPVEVERCSPFLRAQIRAIRPAVVVGLGRHAGMLLSRREDMSLRAMRGARLEYDATSPKEAPRSLVMPLVVTYHPAYVLRQSGDAEKTATGLVMTDLRRALDIARQSVRDMP
ncbi:MAG: uracil-DNA glycosylase [Nannocystales bacterium]